MHVATEIRVDEVACFFFTIPGRQGRYITVPAAGGAIVVLSVHVLFMRFSIWLSSCAAVQLAGDRSGAQIVDDTLRQAAARGINTVRMWAHTTSSLYPFQVRRYLQTGQYTNFATAHRWSRAVEECPTGVISPAVPPVPPVVVILHL